MKINAHEGLDHKDWPLVVRVGVQTLSLKAQKPDTLCLFARWFDHNREGVQVALEDGTILTYWEGQFEVIEDLS